MLAVTYANDAWAALADPTRRAIFAMLVERPSSVGGLAGAMPVSRPAVSQHLRVLADAGLVVGRQDGRQRIYRVDPDGLARLHGEVDRFWSQTLAAYKLAAEQTPEEET